MLQIRDLLIKLNDKPGEETKQEPNKQEIKAQEEGKVTE